MSDAIASVLSQIRALQTQVRPEAAPAAQGATGGVNFGDVFKGALQKVNTAQAESRDLATAFELGDPRADLARVMVAQQQSQLAFRATVEVRNRLVQAYQDVMNMPL